MDYLSDLNSREAKAYAILMYDAIGKEGSGIVNGNFDRLGSYSECLSAQADTGNFRGEYCKLQVEQDGTKFIIAICVPNSCSSQEIALLAKMDVFEFNGASFLDPLPKLLTYNETSVTVTDAVCSKGLFSIDVFAVLCLCFCGLLIILAIIGSIYSGILQLRATSSFARCKNRTSSRERRTAEQDKTAIKSHSPLEENDSSEKRKSCWDHLMKSFSLQENIPALLDIQSNQREYPTLDGIRVLSLLWIISGHTSQLASAFNIDNSLEWKANVLEKPVYFYTLSGPVYLGVDSFFLLRIQPLHLSSICISIGLIALVNWGSFWELPKHQWDNCRRVWWANLLLITNFVSVSESCSGWAWYLSNDFQFHLTIPLLIFLYVKAKCLMIAAVTLLILASIIATTLLSFFLQLSIRYPTGESHSRLNYWVEYYTKPYCRYGPFLVGIILAILISQKQAPYLKNKAQALTGWFCALLTMLLVITLSFVLDDSPPSYSIMAALYQGLHRTIWAVAVSWIIISCQEGYGGFVNKMLSCRIWSALSKISYACYLMHPIIIILYCGLQETLFHYLDINMFYLFIGHCFLTFTAGLALTILVERPFHQFLYI
ncbi:O-acyltransferase like protein-like [Rhinophrynus dorsalis]